MNSCEDGHAAAQRERYKRSIKKTFFMRLRPFRGYGTKAVVNSIVLILILDYFLTRFLLYLE